MRSRLLYSFVCGCLAAAGATLTAQQPTPPEKPPVTVLTGCLRSSGADVAVAGPDGRIYTLEVVEPPAKSASTSSSPAVNPPVASKTVYSLSAPSTVGLNKHVDRQVQLTGRLQTPSPAAKPAGAAGAPADRKPAAGGGHRTFEVSGLEMVAPKCTM